MAVQRGKPLDFGFEFFLATRSHKKLLPLFRAFNLSTGTSEAMNCSFNNQFYIMKVGYRKLQRQQMYSTLQVSFL